MIGTPRYPDPVTPMEIALAKEGFKKEVIMWSFLPVFIKQCEGLYWDKRIAYEKPGYSSEIDIGVVLNEDTQSMEVYICECVVGCCGWNRGIHPFSVEKINEIIIEKMEYMDDEYRIFKIQNNLI